MEDGKERSFAHVAGLLGFVIGPGDLDHGDGADVKAARLEVLGIPANAFGLAGLLEFVPPGTTIH